MTYGAIKFVAVKYKGNLGKYPSANDLVHLFTPICLAIDYAHQKGMLHRDIKPSNILLDERSPESRLHTGPHSSLGEPILSDFGIAKLLEATPNTLSGWWLGTPYYTSPEQARGATGDIRSDLYSLGVILYELCTGVRPFQGDNPVTIMLQQIHATPTPPILINPQISVELNVMILRSIAKEPAERFPHAIDMAIVLAQALNWPVPAVLGETLYSLQTAVEMARRTAQPVGMTSFQSHPSLQMPNSSSTPSGSQSGSTSSTPSGYRAGPPSAPFGSQQNQSSMGSSSGTSPARYSGLNTPRLNDSHYFAMQEYIKGESLEWHIEHLNLPMEEREVLLYSSQILDVLDYLGKEIPPKVHGDIRPATIIIGANDGRAHLMGIGTATSEGRNTQGEQRNTGYAPLEQFQGHAEPRSDLYALGATMHHLLTKRNPRNYPPFVYPLACQINPQLSKEVERILIRALTNDISQRYQSAAEMKRDIDSILSQPISPISSGRYRSTPQQTNMSVAQAETVPLSQQHGKRKHSAFLYVSLALLLLLALIAFPLFYSHNTFGLGMAASNTQASVPPNGIGVTRETGGEYIGISDGTFAFDTGRIDGALKIQAAQALKHNNVNAAMSLLNQAVTQDTSDAEALIYLEDLRVLNSGRPYITLVAGTMVTGGSELTGVGRSFFQGAYLAQKESNDGSKLSGGVLVRLLLANSGSNSDYATLVAQQIVQLARTDPHFVGVCGWPYSSRSIKVIKVLGPAHIPMVSSKTSGDVFTNISPYFFRAAPPNIVQAIAGAKYAEQTLNAKAVATFYDPNDPYSQNLAQDFDKQFEADGNSVVAQETYTIYKPETLPARLQDALTHHPDLIYFAGYSNDVSTVLINLPPGNMPVMGGDALYELGGYASSAHADFSRLHFTTFFYPDEWDVLGYTNIKPAFFAEYAGTYDPNSTHQSSPYGFTRADYNVALTYDATQALLKGCDIALGGSQKTITPQDLQRGLTKVNGANAIQGVSGQITFGPDGNPIDKAIVILYVDPQGHVKMEPIRVGRFLK
jgi:eukaryotic-like serine/threonine-protein kinase